MRDAHRSDGSPRWWWSCWIVAGLVVFSGGRPASGQAALDLTTVPYPAPRADPASPGDKGFKFVSGPSLDYWTTRSSSNGTISLEGLQADSKSKPLVVMAAGRGQPYASVKLALTITFENVSKTYTLPTTVPVVSGQYTVGDADLKHLYANLLVVMNNALPTPFDPSMPLAPLKIEMVVTPIESKTRAVSRPKPQKSKVVPGPTTTLSFHIPLTRVLGKPEPSPKS